MPAHDHVYALVQNLLRRERAAEVIGACVNKELEKVVLGRRAAPLDDSLQEFDQPARAFRDALRAPRTG